MSIEGLQETVGLRALPAPDDASRYYWQTKQDNARARALYDKVARFAGFIRYDYPMA